MVQMEIVSVVETLVFVVIASCVVAMVTMTGMVHMATVSVVKTHDFVAIEKKKTARKRIQVQCIK